MSNEYPLKHTLISANAKAEGKRLEAEEEESRLIQYGPFTIKCTGLPTMIDGKMRIAWCGTTHGTNCCPICDAGPLERAKRNGNFTPIGNTAIHNSLYNQIVVNFVH